MEDAMQNLSLQIEANSLHDMATLLKQALYEIGKALPTNTRDDFDLYSGGAPAIFGTDNNERVTRGNMEGSLGAYRFEFLHCTKRFFQLEQDLLSQGYRIEKATNLFWVDYYVHPTLAPKVISGEPLEIVDYLESQTS